MRARHGERVHKIAIDAGFTCPNRDGSIGRGGCTFCNNVSFSPNGRQPKSIDEQIASGRQVISKRTGASKYLAYFQAYTNTYADSCELSRLYNQALEQPDIIGLDVGTRPDCVPDDVLDVLCAAARAITNLATPAPPVFIGWQDEAHDQQPATRQNELALAMSAFDEFNQSQRPEVLDAISHG